MVSMVFARAARYWKKTHIAILFFCNIYCDMKKKKQMILISLFGKKKSMIGVIL